LIPALGAEGAARLAAEMLQRTATEALASGVGPVELCADPEPKHPDWAAHIPDGVELSFQGAGDLGERLARAARRVVAGGDTVVLIGTDCPELEARRLGEAASKLAGCDAVIHPSRDGGYALLGLARFDASLFEGIAWSTDSVASETIARIEALGWSLHVGETLRDIDEPADLP
jgi:rSAM/selenodomain-associated transferase 1